MASLYEGLKLARELLIRHELIKTRSSLLSNNSTLPINTQCHCNKSAMNQQLVDKQQQQQQGGEDHVAFIDPNYKHNCCCSPTNNKEKVVTLKSYSIGLLSKGHLLQTLLHMLQITVSYMLMLVFMTYNVWLCTSVVLGAGFGYFLFGNQRLTSIDVNEHCH